MIAKVTIVSAAVLSCTLFAAQASAGPCSQDIAVLDSQMTQMGVDPSAKANADTTGSTGNTAGSTGNTGSSGSAGMTPPGVSAAKGVTTLPEKSVGAQATAASAGSQKVDPRAITALQEARKADIQGDAKKCKDALDTVHQHFKG